MTIKKSLFLVVLVAAMLTLAGCQKNVPGDIFPTIPLIDNHMDTDLEVRYLPNISLVQFANNSSIHAFGYDRGDNGRNNAQSLFVYDKEFVLKEKILIRDDASGLVFIDPDSNVMVLRGTQLRRYDWPAYREQEIAVHPVYAMIQKELQRALLPSSRSLNFDTYRELKQAGQDDEIDRINTSIEENFMALMKNNLLFSEIDAIYKLSSSYFLIMKDGRRRHIPKAQTANGKVSTHKFFQRQNLLSIRDRVDQRGQGISLDESTSEGYLEQTDFSLTTVKSLLESRPNKGYKLGLYYYELTFGGQKTTFKVEDFKGNTPIKEISKKGYPIMFLRVDKGIGQWYLVKRQ